MSVPEKNNNKKAKVVSGKSGLFSLTEAARLALASPRCAFANAFDKLSGRVPNYPRMVLVYLTNRCNFACPMCTNADLREEGLTAGAADIPFPVLRKAIEESGSYGSIFHLFGGEPLLYKHLEETLQLLRKNRLISFMTTNGLFLERKAEMLASAGLSVVHVSLDGWDEPSQLKRGYVKGSFDRLLEGVRAVKKYQRAKLPVIRLSTVITRENYHSLDKIQEVVAGAGVDEWTIGNYFFAPSHIVHAHERFKAKTGIGDVLPMHVIETGRYLNEDQVEVLRATLDRVRENNKRFKMRIDYNFDLDLKAYYSGTPLSPASSCDFPYFRVDLHPDGGLTLCAGSHNIGNLHSTSLREAWSGEQARYLRDAHAKYRVFPMCFRCCGIQKGIQFQTAAMEPAAPLVQIGQAAPSAPLQ